MVLGVGFGMGLNALISTGVMFTVWEREEKSLLDILSEFALFCLSGSNTGEIDVSLLCTNINNEFGIEIYYGVAESVLKRLHKRRSGLLERRSGKYYLITSAINVSDFIASRELAKQRIDRIISSLRSFLEKNSLYYNPSIDMQDAFTCFLNEYGYYYYQNAYLAGVKNDGCKLNSAIGRFIIQECEKNSEIFSDLLEVFNGLMLARVMQYEVEHHDIRKQKYSGVTFYLDTPLLLALLECLSDYENKSCLQMVTILQELGASFAYFPEHYGELVDILTAYIHSRNDPSRWRTLEGLDKKRYSVLELATFKESMNRKLKVLGINEKRRPYYEYYQKDPNKRRKFINETELSLYLQEKIPAYNSKQEKLDNDVQAIAAIAILRDGAYTSQVEKCKAAFVVSNKALARHATYFLESQFGTTEVSLILDDIYLSTHAWLKAGRKRSSFTLLRVMADSMAAIRPKFGFREAVLAKIELMKSRGEFSDVEAEAAQENWMLLDDWQALTNGDPDAITTENVKSAVDRFKDDMRKKYQKEKEAEMNALRQHSLEEAERVLKGIDADVESIGINLRATLKWSAIIILVIPACISLVMLAFEKSNVNAWVILSLVFSGLSILDFLIQKLNYVIRLTNKTAGMIEDHIRKREVEKARKYNALINEIAESKSEISMTN